MFTILRLTIGIALLAYVGCTVRDMKNRYVNHEGNICQTASIGSVASTLMNGAKDLAASRTGGGNGGTGFYGGKTGSYNGSYTSSDNSTSSASGSSKTISESIQEFYPDQNK